MINRPIWLRAVINNARVTTASAHPTEDMDDRQMRITAGVQLVGFVMAFVFIGYLIGVAHISLIVAESCL